MTEWFRHDTDARNDIKIRKLLRDYPLETLGAYWVCVEILYQNDGYAKRDVLQEELSFYGDEDHISALLEHGLLEEVGNDVITSQRVLSEISWQSEKRQKKVEAGRKGGLSTHSKSSNSKQCSSNAKADASNAKADSSDAQATIQDITRQDNIMSLSNDSLIVGQQADATAEKKSETDLFGKEVEVETDRKTVPYDDIANHWNSKLKDKLPQIKAITDRRRVLMRQRWAEYGGDVFKAIDMVAENDFLTGKTGWKGCGFDWCFQKEHMLKIIEGTYRQTADNRKSSGPTDLNGQYDDFNEKVVTEL